MKKINGFIIVSVVVMAILLVSVVSALTSQVIYKDTKEFGLVKITLRGTNLIDRIFTLFTAYFQKTQVYSGEQVNIKDSLSILGGTCGVEYWEIFIIKNGVKTSLGDVHDSANQLEGCNWEVWVSFVTNELGTYSLEGKWRRIGGTTQTTAGGNTLTVIESPGIDCEWQSWALYQSIPNGWIKWREYKDLDVSDSNPCDEYENEYQTFCDTGYHINGLSNGERVSGIGGTEEIHSCLSDETGTPTDCRDESATIKTEFCTSIGSKACFFDTKIYECTDYGIKGKCWKNIDDCSPKSCSDGQCTTTPTTCLDIPNADCYLICPTGWENLGDLGCGITTHCCKPTGTGNITQPTTCSGGYRNCRTYALESLGLDACWNDEVPISKLDCGLWNTCCEKKDCGKSVTGLNRCNDGTCQATCPPNPCMGEKKVFYSDGSANFNNKYWFIVPVTSTSHSQDGVFSNSIDEIVPGFSLKYFENLDEACCENLTSVFQDSKTQESSTWSLIGSGSKVTLSYSTYQCVKESEKGFCLEFAHRLLNPYLKTNDCQMNTIILLVIVIFGFIVISRFAG